MEFVIGENQMLGEEEKVNVQGTVGILNHAFYFSFLIIIKLLVVFWISRSDNRSHQKCRFGIILIICGTILYKFCNFKYICT